MQIQKDLTVPMLKDEKNLEKTKSLIKKPRNAEPGFKDEHNLYLNLRKKFVLENPTETLYDEEDSFCSALNVETKIGMVSHEFFTNKKQFLPEGCESLVDLKNLYEAQRSRRQVDPKTRSKLIPKIDEVTYGMEVSPNKKYLVTGTKVGSLNIFNLETRELHCDFLRIHSDPIYYVSVSNKYVATGGRDGGVKIFSIEDKKVIHDLQKHHSDSVWALTISNNEELLATTDYDGKIKVIRIQDKQEIFTYDGTQAQSICWSGDDKSLISMAYNGSFKIIDFETKTETYSFKYSWQRSIPSVIPTNDKNLIAFVHGNQKVAIFDLESNVIKQETDFGEQIHSIAISTDGRYIYAALKTTINVWDRQKDEQFCLERHPPSDRRVLGSFVSNGQEWVAKGTYISPVIELFPLFTASETFSFKDNHEDIEYNYRGRRVLGFSNDNSFIVSLYQHSIKVYNFQTKQHVTELDYSDVQAFTITKDSKYLILRLFSGDQVIVINLQTFEKLSISLKQSFNLIYVLGEVPPTSLVECESIVVTEARDILDVLSGEMILKTDDVGTWLTVRALSEGQTFAVLENKQSAIELMDLKSRKIIYTFDDVNKYRNEVVDSGVSSLFVSKDKKYVLSGLANGSIRVVDVESKQEAYYLPNVHNYMQSVHISEDNRYIVSGSGDGDIKVFDLWMKRTVVQYLSAHRKSKVSNVKLTKDKKYIISQGGDNSIKIWNFPYTDPFELNFITTISPKYPDTSVIDPEITEKLDKVQDRTQLLRNYIDTFILPHHWSILHFLAIFKPDVIANFPSYDLTSRVPCLIDSYRKTPLHYLLAQKKFDARIITSCLTYMIEYLEDKKNTGFFELQTVIESLSSISFSVIQKIPSKLAQRYLNVCYAETIPNFGELLPMFGESQKAYDFSKYPNLSQETKERIWKEGDDVVNFYTNLLKLNYEPNSRDMFNAIHTMKHMDDEDLYQLSLTVNLIDHLWKKTKPVMNGLAIIFSVLMILLSLYVGIGERNLLFEIPILLLTLFFLALELFQFKTFGNEYSESVWNWVDMFQLVLTVAFVISKFFEVDQFPGEVWVSSGVIVLGYFRWLSYLRLFRPTRHLIEIIFQVLRDMLGFVTIVVGILLSFSFVFLEFDRSTGTEPEGYVFHFYNTFKLMFGNYDDTENDFSQNIILSLLLVILNVVLLNLLISIIGDTYGKVNESRVKTDCLIRLEMIEETMIVLRYLKGESKAEGCYIIYCIPDLFEDINEPDEVIEEIKDIKCHISNEITNTKDYVKQQNEESKTQIEKIKAVQDETKNEIKSLILQHVETKKEVQRLEEGMQNLREEMRDLFAEQMQQIKQILKK